MDCNLSIIQRTHDLALWFVPYLHRLPNHHRRMLGERIESTLYDLLELLNQARYARSKLELLDEASARVGLLRCQIRLLVDLGLMDDRRYGHVSGLVDVVGRELGGWRRQQGGAPDATGGEPLAGSHRVGESRGRRPPRAPGKALQTECPFV